VLVETMVQTDVGGAKAVGPPQAQVHDTQGAMGTEVAGG